MTLRSFGLRLTSDDSHVEGLHPAPRDRVDGSQAECLLLIWEEYPGPGDLHVVESAQRPASTACAERLRIDRSAISGFQRDVAARQGAAARERLESVSAARRLVVVEPPPRRATGPTGRQRVDRSGLNLSTRPPYLQQRMHSLDQRLPNGAAPRDTATALSRSAALLRRLWPAGSSARLHLTELAGCGLVLLALETRADGEEWVRRVQLQIDDGLVAPLAEDLGIEVLHQRLPRSSQRSADELPPRIAAGPPVL